MRLSKIPAALDGDTWILRYGLRDLRLNLAQGIAHHILHEEDRIIYPV